MKRAVAIAIVIGSLGLFALFWMNEVPRQLNGAALPDFPNYYLGGEKLFDGRPVYGPLEADVEERFGVEDYEAYPADPPPMVALLAPLSLLRYDPAWLLLAVVSVVIMASVTYLTAREIGWGGEIATALASVALVTTSFRFLIVRNHAETLVLLLGFLGWRALRRGREGSAGIWWGVATALKLWPGMWLVGLAGRRSPAGVLGGVAAVAGVGLAGLAVVGWGNVADFATEVVGASTRWYGALGNYSLLSLGTALVSPWFGWLLLGLGVLIMVPLYVRNARSADQLWVGGTAMALLLSPLSWLNYLVLAIPALIIVGVRLDIRQAVDRWLLFGLVASLGFWGPIVLAAEVPSVLLSFVPTYGLVGLLVVALRRLGDPAPGRAVGVA